MKYDILNDEIVILYEGDLSVPIFISSKYVNEFYVENKYFVKINRTNDLKENIYKNGFFEKIYKSDKTALYIKHLKKKKEDLSEESVRYRFKKIEVFVLFYKKIYTVLKNKKKLIKLFPEHKK